MKISNLNQKVSNSTTSTSIMNFKSFGNVEIHSERAMKMVSKLDTLASNGKFFSVKFLKKDGSERKITARTQVRKGLSGGERCLPLKYLSVYDVQKQQYRSINPESILEVNSEVV